MAGVQRGGDRRAVRGRGQRERGAEGGRKSQRGRGGRERHISTDLLLALQDVWNDLPAEFLQKLCVCVPRRTYVVLQAKTDHTKD